MQYVLGVSLDKRFSLFLLLFSNTIYFSEACAEESIVEGCGQIVSPINSSLRNYRLLVSKKNSNEKYIPYVWRYSNLSGCFSFGLSDGSYHITPQRMGYTFESVNPSDLPGKLGPFTLAQPMPPLTKNFKATWQLNSRSFGVYGEGGFLDATSGVNYSVIENFKNIDFFISSPTYLPISYRNKTKPPPYPLEYFCSSGPQTEPCPSSDLTYPVSNNLNLTQLSDRIKILNILKKKVILVTGFYANLGFSEDKPPLKLLQDKDQRDASGELPHAVEVYKAGLSKLISNLESLLLSRHQLRLAETVTGIGLEEENTYLVQARTDFLNELFNTTVAAHPGVSLYQWYTMTRCSNAPGDPYCTGNGFVRKIDSHHWVVDQYFLNSEYPSYIDKMNTLNEPAVSIVWTSPNWNQNGTKTEGCLPGSEADEHWWNTSGWKQFYRQVITNVTKGIPTAFYLISRTGCKSSSASWRPATYTGNDPKKMAIRRFVTDLSKIAIPYLRTTLETLRDPDSFLEMPAWIPKYCESAQTAGCHNYIFY